MSTYNIYSSLINNTHKRLKKTLPKKEKGSKLSAIRFILENEPQLIHSLDFPIFCEEWSWMKNGYHTIFPESITVLQRLLSADFDTRELSTLEMPFSSFVLAMPKGFEVGGVEIPSVLVTWGQFDRYGEERMDPFTDALGIARLGNRYPEHTKGQMGLQIVHRDTTRNPDLVYARCSLTSDQFHALLKSKDIDEFRDLAGDYKDSSYTAILENEPRDLVIQFTVLKLAIAIAIFNQATEGAHLRDGLPGTKVKMIGRIPGDRAIASTLSMPQIPRDSTSPEAHYRRWHFRQLHNERYYQGQYANRPRGSRWTFVRDAYVGASKDGAHTLEENDG